MKTEELLLEGGELVGKAIAMPVPPSSAGPWRTKSRCSSFRARNISTYQTPDPINEFLMKVSITAGKYSLQLRLLSQVNIQSITSSIKDEHLVYQTNIFCWQFLKKN